MSRVRAHYSVLCATAVRQYAQATGAGRLLLIDGLSQEGDALILAASIAGTASVVVESDPEAVRYCVRNGIVDFAVNTLDEALRILKNEIRRQQPVAVLLEYTREQAAAGIFERGVQPDLLRCSDDDPACQPWKQGLEARGAISLADAPAGARSGTDVCWRSQDSTAALRQLDLLASEILPHDDLERQNWVARAPRYLPRSFRTERFVWMTLQECHRFAAAVEERARQGALAGAVSIEANGQVRTFS